MKFLSSEWAEALTSHLNASDAFKGASANASATIQQVIDGPDGEVRYWTRVSPGSIEMEIGEAEAPDATITQSYDTAVALARRELSPVTGYMMGKIKIAGNMGLLLGLQGVLTQIADAMGTIEVDY